MDPEVLQKSHFIIVTAISFNNENQILMMQEAKASIYGSWFFPAGKVERFEDLDAAVKREVLEETGMNFVPENIFHLAASDKVIYIYFIGHIIGGTLKNLPDEESLSAKWFSVFHLENVEKGRHFAEKMSPEGFRLRAPVMHIIRKALSYRKNSQAFMHNNHFEYLVLPKRTISPTTCQVRVVLVRTDSLHYLLEKNPSLSLMILPCLQTHIYSIKNVIHFLLSTKNLEKFFMLRHKRVLEIIYTGSNKEMDYYSDGYLITIGLGLEALSQKKSIYEFNNSRFFWFNPNNQSESEMVEAESLLHIKNYHKHIKEKNVFLPSLDA